MIRDDVPVDRESQAEWDRYQRGNLRANDSERQDTDRRRHQIHESVTVRRPGPVRRSARPPAEQVLSQAQQQILELLDLRATRTDVAATKT